MTVFSHLQQQLKLSVPEKKGRTQWRCARRHTGTAIEKDDKVVLNYCGKYKLCDFKETNKLKNRFPCFEIFVVVSNTMP